MSKKISIPDAVQSLNVALALGAEQGPSLNAFMAGVDDGYDREKRYTAHIGTRDAWWYNTGWDLGVSLSVRAGQG